MIWYLYQIRMIDIYWQHHHQSWWTIFINKKLLILYLIRHLCHNHLLMNIWQLYWSCSNRRGIEILSSKLFKRTIRIINWIIICQKLFRQEDWKLTCHTSFLEILLICSMFVWKLLKKIIWLPRIPKFNKLWRLCFTLNYLLMRDLHKITIIIQCKNLSNH